MRGLRLPGGDRIPARHLSVRASRSGGPGGQHVNKTETRVELRLDLAGAEPTLGAMRTERIRRRLAGRLDADGQLRVFCDETRSRSRNEALALERLEALLAGALHERRTRKATRPTRASKARRLHDKRAHAHRKSLRRRPSQDD